ncbi:MAG: trypsin-like serine peptidase, partial [Planctomycetota bacterium]
GCNPVSPPVADQFPIVDYTFENNGPGDDWSVLKAGTNNLLQTPYDRYGVFRPISFQPGHANDTVEVTGYGADDTCTLTFTQQYGVGFICQAFSNAYTFAVDIRGGNSGSALMRSHEVIGVVTHCPCHRRRHALSVLQCRHACHQLRFRRGHRRAVHPARITDHDAALL